MSKTSDFDLSLIIFQFQLQSANFDKRLGGLRIFNFFEFFEYEGMDLSSTADSLADNQLFGVNSQIKHFACERDFSESE